ncbi:alpha/beta fold hydrolase [Haloechinothrix sp. LS1_15]|uniref:alpha/beta fold hydrolase n=1 Tax=Haloechinothrix sp. LS1_15 TaxID=2652248 RepID=UPI002945B8D8|nr:alpha/beta fold hydrolase [Haloechinothrix sp. LS1_15]MDV6013398.1 alpha/beta fold hydrolase [Haloechinothrix sp. LS1_15]
MAPGSAAVTGALDRLIAIAQNGLEVLRFGGLDTGEEPSEYRVVERRRMFRLRRYFPATATSRPPVLLVPPMMLAADVYDVAPSTSAVAELHRGGLDAWVIDFGAPDREAGGLTRSLTDHVVAVSEAIELVAEHTGSPVYLAGYSQGGMFCYQAAAYRKSDRVAGIVTFGSPADPLAAAPLGLPENVVTTGAEFLADHVFSRLALPGWAARAGFRLLDPVKAVRARLDFLRQLHDREALLGRERQRRFLEAEGWVAWSGPAIVELLRQFFVHNRMVTGGFVIGDRTVTLADITCPILVFVGEIDDIGQPAAVRGIGRAAPEADVHEVAVRAGHFGLVVGSEAMRTTWPSVAQWVHWRSSAGAPPEAMTRLRDPAEADRRRGGLPSVVTNGLNQLAGAGFELGRDVAQRTASAARATTEVAEEASRAVPRLVRLGRLQANTRVSLGQLLHEQASRDPQGECFLFDDRVHTNGAVAERIDNVVRGLIRTGVREGDHVGVLMDTRPSALVAIAALSRLGAVGVLLPPVADLSAALRLGRVSAVLVDPQHLRDASGCGVPVLVLGGGADRELGQELGQRVIDMERIDPGTVELPAWYRPNPGRARDLAFVMFSGSGEHLETKMITNHRWAMSAFGTASAAALTSSDTVYCGTPLHHPSALLTSVGGAVAAGARIALTRGFDPSRCAEEVRRYGVTVMSYTWTLPRKLLGDPGAGSAGERHRNGPIRLFVGSGMPRGLWRRVTAEYSPARVLEFYAATEADVVLANLSGAKPGAKGRPLPGSAEVALAAFDAERDVVIEDERGFARHCAAGEVGLLLADPATGWEGDQPRLRSVFRPGDRWVPTGDLFVRDAEGDYWLMDNRDTVIGTSRGVVFTQAVSDALTDHSAVDLAVTYGVAAAGRTLAVTAVTLLPGGTLTGAGIAGVLSELTAGQWPDIVHVVDSIPVTDWYRPRTDELRAAGVPGAGEQAWYYDSDGESETGRARTRAMYRPLTRNARERLAG